MKNRVLIVILMFCVGVIRAQSIKGRITDSNNTPLPDVTVRALTADSMFVSGGITDKKGCFLLQLEQNGKYLLHVSSVGYKSRLLSIMVTKDDSLSVISLDSNNVLLKELEVRSSSFVREDGKLLILPEKQAVKLSSNGYDLLYRLRIPGVDVDRQDGKVSIFFGDVSLYIDGRKVDKLEIRGIRPKDIEKIEFYDVPSGKYINDNASINFIMKKMEEGGYLSFKGEQLIGYTKGKYETSAKLVHGCMNYTLFAGCSAINFNGDSEDKLETFIFPGNEIMRNSNRQTRKVSSNNQYLQLNVNNQNNRHNWVGKLSFVRNHKPRNYSLWITTKDKCK